MKLFWKKERNFSIPAAHHPREMDSFALELMDYGISTYFYYEIFN